MDHNETMMVHKNSMMDHAEPKLERKRYGIPRERYQPPTQTAKANATPRLGQRKFRSPFKRLHGQRSKYGIVSDGYNVGRSRRMS